MRAPTKRPPSSGRGLREYTPKEVNKIAPVVAQLEGYVIRATVVSGELRVFSHRHDGEAELIPLRYVLGHNALTHRRLP